MNTLQIIKYLCSQNPTTNVRFGKEDTNGFRTQMVHNPIGAINHITNCQLESPDQLLWETDYRDYEVYITIKKEIALVFPDKRII